MSNPTETEIKNVLDLLSKEHPCTVMGLAFLAIGIYFEKKESQDENESK